MTESCHMTRSCSRAETTLQSSIAFRPSPPTRHVCFPPQPNAPIPTPHLFRSNRAFRCGHQHTLSLSSATRFYQSGHDYPSRDQRDRRPCGAKVPDPGGVVLGRWNCALDACRWTGTRGRPFVRALLRRELPRGVDRNCNPLGWLRNHRGGKPTRPWRQEHRMDPYGPKHACNWWKRHLRRRHSLALDKGLQRIL